MLFDPRAPTPRLLAQFHYGHERGIDNRFFIEAILALA
jgi:hypothetical protein